MGDVVSIGGGKPKDVDPKHALIVSINSEILTHLFTTLMWTEFNTQAHLVTMADMIRVCDEILAHTPEMQDQYIDPTNPSLILNPHAILVGIRAAINEILEKGT